MVVERHREGRKEGAEAERPGRKKLRPAGRPAAVPPEPFDQPSHQEPAADQGNQVKGYQENPCYKERMFAERKPRRVEPDPVDARHQRREQGRLARIEIAAERVGRIELLIGQTVLDHIDGVPAGSLARLIDRVGNPLLQVFPRPVPGRVDRIGRAGGRVAEDLPLGVARFAVPVGIERQIAVDAAFRLDQSADRQPAAPVVRAEGRPRLLRIGGQLGGGRFQARPDRLVREPLPFQIPRLLAQGLRNARQTVLLDRAVGNRIDGQNPAEDESGGNTDQNECYAPPQTGGRRLGRC